MSLFGQRLARINSTEEMRIVRECLKIAELTLERQNRQSSVQSRSIDATNIVNTIIEAGIIPTRGSSLPVPTPEKLAYHIKTFTGTTEVEVHQTVLKPDGTYEWRFTGWLYDE